MRTKEGNATSVRTAACDNTPAGDRQFNYVSFAGIAVSASPTHLLDQYMLPLP